MIPRSPVGNAGLLRPGGNRIFKVHRAQLWRQVPDVQANLHDSAKNGQNVDKKQQIRYELGQTKMMSCRGVCDNYTDENA